MFTKQQVQIISHHISEKIISIKPVSGGDISDSYLLTTDSGYAFLKTHTSFGLLEAEKIGLQTISSTNTIKTPEVLGFGSLNHLTFLALEWIDSKSPNYKELESFGYQLAQLHLNSHESFGFTSNTYIGSLLQSNKQHNNWNDFYIEERLYPQLELAKSNQLLQSKEIPTFEQLKDNCYSFLNKVKPSLLHGDLWSGNYLISSFGEPYLIDPSVYYGHNEIDIAMSKLFGGFSLEFYSEYHKIIPKDEYTDNRIELYQLYYLLVHLNLFGNSYYSGVKTILNKYF